MMITGTLTLALMACSMVSCSGNAQTQIQQTAHVAASEIAQTVNNKTSDSAAPAPVQIPTQTAAQTPVQTETQVPVQAPAQTQAAPEAPAPTQATAAETAPATAAPQAAATTAAPAPAAPAAAPLTASDMKLPQGKLKQGQSFTVGGSLSASEITEVYGGVYETDGNPVLYCDDAPHAASYDLGRKFDNTLEFDRLRPGSYVYRIYVRTGNSGNNGQLIAESYFTVEGASPAAAGTKVSASNVKFPQGNHEYGKSFTVGGILTASDITEVFGGVYRKDGMTPVLYCEDAPHASAYDLGKKFDDTLAFDTLEPGSYVYKIFARTGNNGDTTQAVIESEFHVSFLPPESIYADVWGQSAIVTALELAGSDYKAISTDKGFDPSGLKAWVVKVQKFDGSDPTVLTCYVGSGFAYMAEQSVRN